MLVEILRLLHLPVTIDDECFSISYLLNDMQSRKIILHYEMSHQVPLKRPKLMFPWMIFTLGHPRIFGWSFWIEIHALKIIIKIPNDKGKLFIVKTQKNLLQQFIVKEDLTSVSLELITKTSIGFFKRSCWNIKLVQHFQCLFDVCFL